MRYILIICILLASCRVTREPGMPDPVITLEKTACFGACPVYTLNIYNSGIIELTGKENLPYKGKYCSRLKRAEWTRIRQAYLSGQFFSFKDQYTSRVKDLPSTFVTFRSEGKSKTIEDYDGAPEELKKLEEMVVRLIETQRWKACRNKR